MPAEHKIIFLCTRLEINDSARQEVRKLVLNNCIDWNKIIEISNRHEILPFLYYNLNKLNLQDIIPQDIYSTLKNYYYVNLDRNIRFYKKLSSILELANHVQINIVLLKGVSLVETIYKNPALRTMADIDILAKDSELPRLKALLLQLGYREIFKDVPSAYMQRYQLTFGFVKSISPNLSLYIDLHRVLIPARPYKINLPRLWEGTQEKLFDGQKITFLSFENTFLFLVLHLRGHLRQPLLLKSICDIAELLNLYGNMLDWEYIQIAATKNHIINNIYFALYISKELLDASVSNILLNRFRPRILKCKLIHLCMNRYNFLNARIWQGFILRFLLFDRTIDFFLYLWRVSFLERLIARGDLRKILTIRIFKKSTNINTDEITKK